MHGLPRERAMLMPGEAERRSQILRAEPMAGGGVQADRAPFLPSPPHPPVRKQEGDLDAGRRGSSRMP